MNDRQRVLLVVAIGLAVAVVVGTWDSMISANDGGGWFAYAPNTAVIVDNRSSDIFRSGILWLGAVILWAVTSFWLLRDGRTRSAEGSTEST